MDKLPPMISNLSYTSGYSERERTCVDFVPTKPSPEALICLGCNVPKKKCKGDCERYKTEHKKLKEQL